MQRTEKRLVILFSALGIVGCILPVLLKPGQYPSDDAYFYLQIASNIASGFGSTFNRITPTNGFHPLWQYICAGIFFITGNNKEVALWLVCFFQQILFLGIIYFVYRLNEFLKLRYWYLAIPVLALYYLCIGTYASEAHLHGFFLVALSYFFFKEVLHPQFKIGDWLRIGLLSGVLFLARLDSVFILAIFTSVGFWKCYNSESPVRMGCFVAMCTPIGACISSYCLYNYSVFGHCMPISGAIKSTFPHIAGYIESLYPMGLVSTVATIIAIVAGLLSKNTSKRLIYISVGCGSLLLSTYVFLFTHHFTSWAWYYVPGIFLLAVIVADSFELITTKIFSSRSVQLALVLLFVLFSLTSLRSWSEYTNAATRGFSPFQLFGATDTKWQMELAAWLKKKLPPHTNIYMYDWPGFVAYYSDMNILPVDGLVNDYEYNDRLRSVGISAFLNEKKVDYWLGPNYEYPQPMLGYENAVDPDSSQIITIYSPLYRISCGTFFVSNSTKVSDLKGVSNDPEMPDLSLWKIKQ